MYPVKVIETNRIEGASKKNASKLNLTPTQATSLQKQQHTEAPHFLLVAL